MRRSLFTLALLALSAGYLPAQESSRVLNGFEFIPSRVVADPFAITYFGTTTGGGMAFDLKTPFVDLSGDTLGTLTGDVAFMTLGFNHQQRFGNWFAARIGVAGSARLGIDEQSVLAQGVTGSFAWNLGATARIFQSEKVIVSGAVDFGRTDLVGLDPFGFAQKIIDEGLEAEDNELVGNTEAISAVAGVRAGWAPAPWGRLPAGRSRSRCSLVVLRHRRVLYSVERFLHRPGDDDGGAGQTRCRRRLRGVCGDVQSEILAVRI